MRRLVRWTLNTLAILSLLLGAAVACLWVRSAWIDDEVDAYPADLKHCRVGEYEFRSRNGTLTAARGFFQFESLDQAAAFARYKRGIRYVRQRAYANSLSSFNGTFWGRRGFAAWMVPGSAVDRSRDLPWSGYLLLPDWFVMAILLIPASLLAARRVRQFRRRRRHFRGECLACGYYLFANVSGVCPECGTTIHHESAT